MNKHTPGPWIQNYDCVLASDHPDDVIVECMWRGEDDESSETIANARLIAAAPDLLEAAQKVLSHKRSDGDWLILSTYCEDLEAAIAKAIGERNE